MATAQEIHDMIADIADDLRRRLNPGPYLVTVVARYIGDELEDADMVVTPDDIGKVIESLRRLQHEPAVIIDDVAPTAQLSSTDRLVAEVLAADRAEQWGRGDDA